MIVESRLEDTLLAFATRLSALDVDGKRMGLTKDGLGLPQESVKEGMRRAKFWVMDQAGTEPSGAGSRESGTPTRSRDSLG